MNKMIVFMNINSYSINIKNNYAYNIILDLKKRYNINKIYYANIKKQYYFSNKFILKYNSYFNVLLLLSS